MCNNFTVIDASFANHNKSEVRSQIITRENNVLKKNCGASTGQGTFRITTAEIQMCRMSLGVTRLDHIRLDHIKSET